MVDEENPSQATIILLGGELRYTKGAMVGDFTRNNLAQVTAKKCFMGCSGLSPDIGMTTEMVSEVNLNQMMFKRVTGSAYILADSSKFGEKIGSISCPPEKHRKYHHGFGSPGRYGPAFREIGTWVYQVD